LYWSTEYKTTIFFGCDCIQYLTHAPSLSFRFNIVAINGLAGPRTTPDPTRNGTQVGVVQTNLTTFQDLKTRFVTVRVGDEADGNRFFTAGITIFAAVAAHNTLGYLTGYLVGKMTGMNKAKCRTISIEVGCQNAGLGTALASRHFAQLPEAALVSAVACVYHSLSGTLLANLFALADRRAERRAAKVAVESECDAVTR